MGSRCAAYNQSLKKRDRKGLDAVERNGVGGGTGGGGDLYNGTEKIEVEKSGRGRSGLVEGSSGCRWAYG